MSEIDIERLKVDSEYWDEVAPDGCVRLGVAYIDGKVWSHEFLTSTTAMAAPCGADVYFIPRPTKQEWVGGLPHVGVECEIQYLGKYNNNWMPFRVTAVTNDFVVGYIKNDRESAVNHKDPYVKFRPLKSKQERQREELASTIFETGYVGESFKDIVADAILSRYNLKPKPYATTPQEDHAQVEGG